MNEKAVWKKLKDLMGAHWHATRHEDIACQGVPDVSYGLCGVQGWIELKYLPSWPKSPRTPVRIPHFTKEQRLWTQLRHVMGCRVWLLLVVGHHPHEEWLLFDAITAARIGTMTRAQMYVEQSRGEVGRPEAEEMVEILKGK